MPVVFCQFDEPCLDMRPGETHVYAAELATGEPFLEHLTDDERTRAQRFRLGRVRDQFVASRGRLRTLLGRYLGLEPRTVPIWYADGGKPYVPERPLEFNVSHTDGLAVFAVSRFRVGVDVEQCRIVPDADGLVARFFSRNEAATFAGLSPEHRHAAFFRAWTRKEAVLKAIGRGVQSLDCCDVTFLAHEPPRLLRLDDDAQAGQRWEVFTWEPAPGYCAAGAVERIAE